MKKELHMIGNTHFDPVWLWTWDEAMSSIRATFHSALERMKEYPDFKYSFSPLIVSPFYVSIILQLSFTVC